MFALAALCVTVLAQPRGSTCKEACVRYVTDARLKANLCGRCFTETDRGAWAAALGDQTSVPESDIAKILDDGDWKVRWGAVRALAKRRAVTDGRVLMDLVLSSKPGLACSTALHVAGAKKQTPSALLQPQGAAVCWEHRSVLVPQLELEMYAELEGTRLEAAAHLASFLERPITRVVLDAMKSRAPETDELSAGLLVSACHLGGPPAGKAMLDVKKGDGDDALVNRVLAVWSKQIDAERKSLQATERAERRAALAVLADLAPLSAPELETALDDADASNRKAAAEALARGAGLTPSAFAQKKIDPAGKVEAAVRLKWIAAIGSSQDADCRATLSAALVDERLQLEVRKAALPALVDCAGVKVLPTVIEAQGSSTAELRAGAALALGGLPRQVEVPKRLELALADTDPQVLAAAAHAVGVLRQRTVVGRLLELAEHANAEVRREAVVALSMLETPQAVPRLIRAVTEDAAPEVRIAAARALGESGTAAAVPALITASESDKDGKVKFVAAESLRKLGFKRSSGSMSP